MTHDYPVTFIIRAKFLGLGFLMLLAMLIGIGFFWAAGHRAMQLAESGKETIATVIESETVTRRLRRTFRNYDEHLIRYDGHEKHIDLDQLYPPGTKFYAIYARDDPMNVKISQVRESVIDYFLAEMTLKGLLIFGAFVIGGGFFSYRAFRVGFLSRTDIVEYLG